VGDLGGRTPCDATKIAHSIRRADAGAVSVARSALRVRHREQLLDLLAGRKAYLAANGDVRKRDCLDADRVDAIAGDRPPQTLADEVHAADGYASVRPLLAG
jgi:hypothetical protein